MATTNFRGYFKPEAGVPPREVDLNEGFIDKVDTDVASALTRLTALEAAETALKTRVDAVITDQGAVSVLRKTAPEFIAFSTGVAALSPGNLPVITSPTKFTVNGNWLTVFTVGRRIELKPVKYYYYVVSAVPIAGGKTEVTVVGDPVQPTLFGFYDDFGVGVIQYGMPRLTLTQIPDDFIPPEKLADPPALASELAAAIADFTADIDGVTTQQDSTDANLATHEAKTNNVHGLGPSDVIETVAGANTKVSTHNSAGGAHSALLATLQPTSAKGAASGYAGLDSGAKIPAAQLPLMGLKGVQRGETVMSDIGASAQSVDTTTFTAVVPGKSFIIITVRGAGATPKVFRVTAEFKAGNAALTLKRADGNGALNVLWQVVEFY